jgi:molybdopterin-guanine dinucleotide biosynthesis protein A
MGADKATLTYAGTPLWTRQLAVLRALNLEVIHISARIRPVWCPQDIELVTDQPPSRGPLSGLAAALRRLHTTHLLALAIDLPEMTSDHLRKLWLLSRPGCGVVPTMDDRFEPLCAIYPVEAADMAAEMLASDDLSLQYLVQTLLRKNRVGICHLSEAERALYRNINTPADLP